MSRRQADRRDRDGPDTLRVLVLADRVEVALAACRALARSDHQVGAASATRTSPVLASRAVAFRHLFPGRSEPQDAWDAALLAAVRERSYDVVLACNDVDVVRLTATNQDIPRAPSISPSQDVIRDKAALAQVCADVGVAYPRTYADDARLDDAAVALAVRGRAVVKAARPAALTSRGVVHMPGMTVAGGPQALRSAIERHRAAGLQAVVQEYVDGPKLQAALIRRSGATTCRLVALVELGTPAEATLRQVDSLAGVGADCITALELVADRAGYEGVLQAEFVVEASGRACLIDLNPRLWGGLSFAELIGLRMTERVVSDALGSPPMPMPAEKAGRRYHHLARELSYIARSPRQLPSVLAHWSAHDVWDAPLSKDLRPLLVRSWQQLRRSPRSGSRAGRAGDDP